jgi:CRP/FNR family transcriptional activator FtrB
MHTMTHTVMTSITTMLRTAPGFAELDADCLEHIATDGDLAEVKAGEVLFCQRTMPESLFVLFDGRICLTGTAEASSAVVDILEPASSFVLANVLMDEPYQMGAYTVADSLLVRIPAQSVRAAVRSRPTTAMALMRAISAEFDSLIRQVVDLKARIAAQRLGTYLLSQLKEPIAATAEFRLPVSKGLLALWLGCRAENLSRAFTTLRAYGVETHGSRVLLHDVGRLRGYAGAILRVQSDGTARQPVEKVFGDAFRLRARRPPHGG